MTVYLIINDDLVVCQISGDVVNDLILINEKVANACKRRMSKSEYKHYRELIEQRTKLAASVVTNGNYEVCI